MNLEVLAWQITVTVTKSGEQCGPWASHHLARQFLCLFVCLFVCWCFLGCLLMLFFNIYWVFSLLFQDATPIQDSHLGRRNTQWHCGLSSMATNSETATTRPTPFGAWAARNASHVLRIDPREPQQMDVQIIGAGKMKWPSLGIWSSVIFWTRALCLDLFAKGARTWFSWRFHFRTTADLDWFGGADLGLGVGKWRPGFVFPLLQH